MSKTAHPHPATYLAFACCVTETAEYLDALLPWSLPPATWATIADELPASFLRYHARDHEMLISELEERERGALLRLGMAADQLDTPETHDYVAGHVRRRLLVLLDVDRRNPLLALRFDEDGDHAPRRETVRKIIVGEHFAQGEGNRAQTARSLNAGLSTRDRGYGITDANVRDALDGFAYRHAREVDTWCAIVANEVRRAGILAQLWHHHREAEPRPQMSGLIRHIEFGTLLDVYGGLTRETPLIENLPPSIRREALDLGREPILAECRRLVGICLARGMDRDAFSEPLRSLVSHHV